MYSTDEIEFLESIPTIELTEEDIIKFEETYETISCDPAT